MGCGRYILDDSINLDDYVGGGVSALTIETDETANTIKVVATNEDETKIVSNAADLSWLKGSTIKSSDYLANVNISYEQYDEDYQYLTTKTTAYIAGDNSVKAANVEIVGLTSLFPSIIAYTYDDTRKMWDGGPALGSAKQYIENGEIQRLPELTPLSNMNYDTKEWWCAWAAAGDIAKTDERPACYKYGFVHGPAKEEGVTYSDVHIDENGGMGVHIPTYVTQFRMKDVTAGNVPSNASSFVAGMYLHHVLNVLYLDATSKFVSVHKLEYDELEGNSYIYLSDDAEDYFEFSSAGLVTHVATSGNKGEFIITELMNMAIV